MPIKKIPIHYGANKNIDEVGLTGMGAALMDGYVDELGNVNRRPGLEELCDLGTGAGIDGIYWWDEQSMAIVVSDGETWKITASDGTKAQLTGDSFETDTRVKFANFGDALYAANGAKIMKITTTTVAEMADGDAPTTVTHPAYLDTYLLANSTGTEKYYYSVVGDADDWAGDYVSAETKKDNLTALEVMNMEIVLLGKRTFEIHRNDGSTPFLREYQGFIESGTIAPYSLTWCGDTWRWIDQERRVMRLEGRTPVLVSRTMNKYLQGFSTITDAVGDYITSSGRSYYVLHFPTEDKTMALDLENDYWYEWGFWSVANAEYNRWKGNCFTLATAWNYSLVGDKSTGIVYIMSDDYSDDDSNIMRTMVRTEHVTHDTAQIKKRSNKLTFRVKRASAVDEASVPELLVKWRDDGSSSWKNEHTMSLGAVGRTDFRGVIRRNGMYYSRQYEMYVTDDAPLLIVSVEEDFDYLGDSPE